MGDIGSDSSILEVLLTKSQFQKNRDLEISGGVLLSTYLRHSHSPTCQGQLLG